jgi:hypothetical protein
MTLTDCQDCKYFISFDSLGLGMICSHPDNQEVSDYQEDTQIKDISSCDQKEYSR